jgi:hypothetical protein
VNGGLPLNPGSTYYLSPYTAGQITAVQPTASGVVHKAVFVATSATSAIVLPFTGGVLSTPIAIVNASSVATTVPQYNKFSLGDMVRFKQYSGGITLNYRNGAAPGASANQFNEYGIFVKAQADTEEDAEVAGMVVSLGGITGTAPNTFYTNFDVLMDGFFDLSTSSLSLNAGSVYFLNTGCAGTSASFESPTVSHNTAFPTQFGQVRKPLFMATGPKSGYLFSYRGDIRAEVGLTGASADVTRFLVNDIRDGFSGDLVVGVYNATNNGRESLRVAAGTAFFNNTRGVTGGVVGVGGGWTNYTAAGNGSRIMAQLDVNGVLRLGTTAAAAATPLGQDIIVLRHDTDTQNGTTMSSRLVIGTDHTDASVVIGHKVRPNRSAAGYISSLNGTHDRAALVVGASGSSPTLRWRIAENVNADLGTTVSLTDVFSISGVTAQFSGTHFNISNSQAKLSVGTSSQSPSASTEHTLDVLFNVNNSAVTDLRLQPGIRIFNDDTTVGAFTTLAFGSPGSYSGWAGRRIGADRVDLQFFSESFKFANGSSNTANDPPMYITGTGRVGMGTNSPTTRLHIAQPDQSNPVVFIDNNAGGDTQAVGGCMGLRIRAGDGSGTATLFDVKDNTETITHFAVRKDTIIQNDLPMYACRAFSAVVNTNTAAASTSASGVIASQNSKNLTVTQSGRGVFQFDFDTNMPSTTYTVVVSASLDGSNRINVPVIHTNGSNARVEPTVSTFYVSFKGAGDGAFYNPRNFSVAVFA